MKSLLLFLVFLTSTTFGNSQCHGGTNEFTDGQVIVIVSGLIVHLNSPVFNERENATLWLALFCGTQYSDVAFPIVEAWSIHGTTEQRWRCMIAMDPDRDGVDSATEIDKGTDPFVSDLVPDGPDGPDGPDLPPNGFPDDEGGFFFNPDGQFIMPDTGFFDDNGFPVPGGEIFDGFFGPNDGDKDK